MSLIKQSVQVTVKDIILDSNTRCLENMKRSAVEVFELLWKNRNHTPQEVCDMFGTDAEKAFDLHSKLQTLIYEIDNTWVPLMPIFPYTTNLDGTLTIVYPEPTPEPELTPEPIEE